jgi:hypothetical protein
MSTPRPSETAAAVTGYRVPSLGWRILGGALRLIPLVVLLIGVPLAVLSFLQSHGISLPIPIATVEYAGIAITGLVVARYVLKPTGAYGPLSIATAAVELVYFYVILLDATYQLAIPGVDVVISIGYRNLILLLMIVPALALGAGLLTTIEDATAPKERFPFDFPP